MTASSSNPGPGSRPIIEAVAFTLVVIVYIWVLRFRWPSTVWLLLLAVVASFRWHSETIESAGLAPGAFVSALVDWQPWFLLVAVTTAIVGGRRVFQASMLYRGFLYFFWCLAQQLVYQTMAYRRLRVAWGPSWRAWVLAGALFAATHLPNPVLTPATLLWGIVSSRLFEHGPSVPALGLLQFFLSSMLLWITPVRWHRNFRVGTSYLLFK